MESQSLGSDSVRAHIVAPVSKYLNNHFYSVLAFKLVFFFLKTL